ncbi:MULTISPECIES: Crp/Fnr family transcriptional regulator [Enterococcus]|uniref:Crp/Fnr family transcriptional regulator n=1 Tax=Enterococcus TaxID=1350 RepID=UPI0003536183|nr:Crp/Fnr family transcriptional regulator [Enterococcus faecalis]EKF8800591.1 Crp/Fnr family transcriptional regulator [Enterococcus faecalis]EPH93646.1 putative listeriolysin regulatory protein [Enterococcus faecalis F01966]EPI34014.1 putative listeriolysin regulatory protein [Enterococcus faecalis VC1B-1]EPI35014.1 putative listeriolysin regulatory protein [Enterococcus faecalis UP2S-6]MDN3115201.1 Crp/Fnr family transcriptional regulator [Enterococcus faecalis]
MKDDIFLKQIQANGLCSKVYKKGEFIISNWKNNYSNIFVEEGILKMTISNAEGLTFTLQHIQGRILILSTSIFNDKAMCKYNLEVVSDTAKLYFLTIDNLTTFMAKSTNIMRYVIDCLEKQLTFVWSKLCDFSVHGKCGALCGQLLVWTYLFGEKQMNGTITIELIATLQDLGDSCGISHVASVSRMLSNLKKEKVIVIENGKIKILKLDILKINAPKIEEWFALNERQKWEKINY